MYDSIFINQSLYIDENDIVHELPGWQQSSDILEILATVNQVEVNVTVPAAVSLQINVHPMT